MENHKILYMILADVIAMVVDGMTTGQHYFNLSSEMFNRNLIPDVWQIELTYISI